ncbi:60S ribosomal protein L44 [Microdochium trichocladiopsis]|uniref:60S ribosomal protein L44 n=1 Tax=Microdochium trichocladiopsis TaxID=1682393 RepID=A0A9P8Y2K0_9PEZI|nr:60S ribosomal protein L44 [Microdochium trichocladiopsis]KAH7026003.1 60S ribosomal protein L44 [Microdochium trichocladiopsis]
MGSVLESTDVKNKLEDLSGVVIKPGENPYNALIDACHSNPAEIQALYSAHRVRRNAQQKEKFLAADYKELIIDQHLLRLEDQSIEPGYVDPRHCMVFWGRPPWHIIELAAEVQRRLKVAAPSLWLMPMPRMHITALELAHSRTAEEIAAIRTTLEPAIPAIANHTLHHRARLVKPMVSYDLSALALSFLPAAGEVSPTSAPATSASVSDTTTTTTTTMKQHDDNYTYHHLRRDLWNTSKDAGLQIDSRYVVPSAHITLGRYLTDADHDTPEKRASWVAAIDEVNAWLEAEVWDKEDVAAAQWLVGQERGLDVRVGTLWYGGGRTVMTGEGF